jgi:hypothetical protein
VHTHDDASSTPDEGAVDTDDLGDDLGVIDAADDGPSSDRRDRRVLALHCAALLVLLLCLIPVIDNGHGAVPDEGVYLAQAENLANGSWSRVRPAADVDPEGQFTAVTDEGVQGDRVVAYFKHPLYPVVITPAFAVAGVAGTMVVSVLGTWLAAVSAALIARRLRPGFAIWTLWLVGVGSPLLFGAYLTIAHSLAAALAGWAFLGLTRAVEGRRWVHLSYALPCVAVIVALRTEGLVFAAALGGATMALALLRRSAHRDLAAAGAGAGVLAAAGAALVVDRWWAAEIGDTSTFATPASRLSAETTDPLSGLWASLLRPFNGGWENVQFWLPLTVLSLVLASVALRVIPKRPLLAFGFLAAGTVASLGLWVSDTGLVTGFVAAFPVLVVGLVWLGRADLRVPTIARSLLTSGLFGAAVTIAMYGIGGATEWGGRFYYLVIPLLAPLAIAGLHHGAAVLQPRTAKVVAGCLALITLALSWTALSTQMALRGNAEDLVRGSRESAVAEGADLLVVAQLYPDGTSRLFWNAQTNPDLLNSGGVASLSQLIEGAAEAGRRKVAITSTDVPTPLVLRSIGLELDRLGWTVLAEYMDPVNMALVLVVGEPAQ